MTKKSPTCAVFHFFPVLRYGSRQVHSSVGELVKAILTGISKKGWCDMTWLNDYRLRLMLVGFVAAVVLGGGSGSVNADFTFGESTNLGPTVNSSASEGSPSISADSLEIFFDSNRGGGSGGYDLWVSTRQTTELVWGTPINLGPPINTPSDDHHPSISLDGLTLYFTSDRPGGYGDRDLWVTTRSATSEPWSEPVNLGPTVNSSSREAAPSISADGLELFFHSKRSGGHGDTDIWVTTRATTSKPWAEPVNLGQGLNSLSKDKAPDISTDGLMLFFNSQKPGTYGLGDIWFSKRATVKEDWDMPVHPGPPVNTTVNDSGPSISADGSILYFHSRRVGGLGYDLWQVPIIPIVDLNGDGIVDAADMCIVVDHWGENYSLCDVGPTPWGDGVVDVEDLIVLAEHLFKVYPSAETVEVNEDDDGGQIELELGKLLVVTLESNPSTGYQWELVENNDSVLKQFGQKEYKPPETSNPRVVGAGGCEIFRFKAVSNGQMTLELVYHRSWEDVEPLKTFSIQVTVN